MMSMVGGKTLCFSEDPIGLDTKVTYIDQNGNEAEIDMRKFYKLAKKSKNEYFGEWLDWLKNKELTIGAFIITGLDKLGREFPEEVYECIKSTELGREFPEEVYECIKSTVRTSSKEGGKNNGKE